jgi:23S rRNA pseudouridine1911/1915/1917 synthase
MAINSENSPEPTVQSVIEGGERLDRYLARHLGISRSAVGKIIQDGGVSVNGQSQKASYLVKAGENIRVVLPSPSQSKLSAEGIPLDIVYEDPDVIVVNKPSGLVVYPAAGHVSHTLINAVINHFPDLVNLCGSPRPGIVHRLDKDTSGLMVIAKNTAAMNSLSGQFKDRTVRKGYLALVKGCITPSEGLIEAPLGRHPSQRQRIAVVRSGREARTSYRVKRYIGEHSLLDITIETGRTHQIRVHLAAIGYPVIGDKVYGIESPLINRQFLHAYQLGFNLPSNGQYVVFKSPLPEDLERALTELK